MKTTLKEYTENIEKRRQAKNAKENARIAENWDMNHAQGQIIETLEKYYFEKLDTVNIEFHIGYRRYFREVVKIGKQYFNHGDKMTKGNGYSSIKEIDAITDDMTAKMWDDSMYY